MRKRIYLDDIRTPIDKNWLVVRNYITFVSKVREIGLNNIRDVSLDHDLGDFHDQEEKTGLDCAKFLIEEFLLNPQDTFPRIYVHSANPIGRSNIIGYVNNFLKSKGMVENCTRSKIDHI